MRNDRSLRCRVVMKVTGDVHLDQPVLRNHTEGKGQEKLGVRLSTSASGSQPSGNTRNDKIQQTPSSNSKNKVEAHPRNVKSSLNKRNVMNACTTDNLMWILRNSMNDVKFHAKPKKKKSKREIWKPTGKVFTKMGYIWRLPSTFTIVGNACPLTRITTTNEVPSRKPIVLDSESPKPVVKLDSVPNPPPSTPFVPPSRSDWDLLFQPMFDESLNPLPYVDLQAPEVIAPIPEVVAPAHAVLTGSPSSTTVESMMHLTNPRGIFINQSKYALESLKKYGFESCDPVDTPMVEKSKLDEDKEGKAVDPSHYRARPIEKHLNAVKRTFVILKEPYTWTLYPKDSSIALTAFADADMWLSRYTPKDSSKRQKQRSRKETHSSHQRSGAYEGTGVYHQMMNKTDDNEVEGGGWNEMMLKADVLLPQVLLQYVPLKYLETDHMMIKEPSRLEQTGGPKEDVREKNLIYHAPREKTTTTNVLEGTCTSRGLKQVSQDEQPEEEVHPLPNRFNNLKIYIPPDRCHGTESDTCRITSVQPWLSNLARRQDPRESFDELTDTTFDFSAFVMNRLNVTTLTPYWISSNNDLEYLRVVSQSRKYSYISFRRPRLQINGHIKWKKTSAQSMWSQVIVNYDKFALWGISHWGKKRRQFYAFAATRESARDVDDDIFTKVKKVISTTLDPDIEDTLLLFSSRKVEKISTLKNVDPHGFEDGGGDFRYSDTVRLSRSDKVLKLKNFKKDATLKISKSTNQERIALRAVDIPVWLGLSLGAQEDASKHGRKIEDLDADAEVTLVNETQEMNDDNLMFDTCVLEKQEIKFEKVVEEPVVSVATNYNRSKLQNPTAATIVTSVRPRAKGIIFHDQEEQPEVPLKKKDQVALDEEMTRNLEAQLHAELMKEERLARQKEEEAKIALIES
ncbi:hypothetical protein Tco_0215259 [Tanacetum coccineum]